MIQHRTDASERRPEARVVAGRYHLLERIGTGGAADVWRALDERLDRHVAVKVLGPGADPAFRRRFTAEARRAASITHPNVVTVLDALDEGDESFIVMELVEGETLDVLVREHGPLLPSRAIAIVAQIAAALDAAHARGVVHCDVKPGNVIVDDRGVAKLTDFGIARALDEDAGAEVVGTARYVAPEQVVGAPASRRSDVYGLALLAYELLAGRPAFEGDDPQALLQARLSGPPPRLREVRRDVAPDLDVVLGRGLARDPARRYASAGAFAVALSAAAHSADRTEPLFTVPLPARAGLPQRPRPPAPRPTRRTALYAAGAAAFVLGLLGLFDALGRVVAVAVTLPDVRGKPFGEAERILRDQGLRIERRDQTVRERFDRVIDQTPPPGAPARAGDVVTLVVARRPTAPNVVGKNRDDAGRVLCAAGFKCPIPWQLDPAAKGVAALTVVKQEPAANTPFEPGQVARIFVAGPLPREDRKKDGKKDDD